MMFSSDLNTCDFRFLTKMHNQATILNLLNRIDIFQHTFSKTPGKRNALNFLDCQSLY